MKKREARSKRVGEGLVSSTLAEKKRKGVVGEYQGTKASIKERRGRRSKHARGIMVVILPL